MVGNGREFCQLYKKKVIVTAIYALILFYFTAVMPISLRLNASNGAALRAEASGESGFIVLEATTLRVFEAENEHARLPIASTTKTMTALVVLENADVNAIVTVPKEAVGIEGSSIYLKEGEKLTVKELLYGLMLRSGNDSAVALALHTAGSVTAFAEKMNAKAEALGLKNSHFVNPHGLAAKGHYSSAYDLAVIAAAGLANPVFKEIVGTKFATVKGATEDETRYFANKNKILYNYSGGNGVKTGYTTEAGRCLIASSEREGMQVVAVAINCYEYFAKCSQMMDFAHENYQMVTLADKQTAIGEVRVKRAGRIKCATLHVKDDLKYPLKRDGSEVCAKEILTSEVIVAPHDVQNSCGELKIYLNNRLLFQEKLYTINSIERRALPF